MKPDWTPGVGLSTFSNFTIMKKLTIADKQKVCRYILHNTEVNGIVEEKHSKWLIKEIFVNHNEWEIKKGVGIDHLEVRVSTTFRKNKEFWIVRTDGTETDISFTKCLVKKDPQKTKIDDIRAACRNAIEPEIIKVKNTITFPFICPILGTIIYDMNQIHIDHYDMTFNELFHKWLKGKDIDELYKKTLSSNKDGSTETYFDDKEIIDDFIEFHNKNTHLRAVSKRANLSDLRRKNYE